MAYQPNQDIDLMTHYRLMDPPLGSLWIGFIRVLSGNPPFVQDWNWGESWQANLYNGHMPSTALLLTARIAQLLLFPFTCYFLYRFGRQMINHWAGLLLVVLFALNPLIMLHTRHAMAEGVLLFFISLLLMLITDQKHHPFLVPLIFGFALNSKQTALFMIPVFLLYGLFLFIKAAGKQRIVIVTTFVILPILVTYLLNPVSWENPIATFRASIHERQVLSEASLQFMQNSYPEKISSSYPERLVLVLYHTFFEPIALDDVANYHAAQAEAFQRYLQDPLQNTFRTIWMGAIALIGVLSAYLLQLTQTIRQKHWPYPGLHQWVLMYCGIIFGLAGLCLLPMIYQRYVLILIPFFTLQIVWLINDIIHTIANKKPA